MNKRKTAATEHIPIDDLMCALANGSVIRWTNFVPWRFEQRIRYGIIGDGPMAIRAQQDGGQEGYQRGDVFLIQTLDQWNDEPMITIFGAKFSDGTGLTDKITEWMALDSTDTAPAVAKPESRRRK